MKFSIDYNKTFLPHSVIRGSQAERFAKAREMNEKLRVKLNKVFDEGKTEITIPRFKQEISRLTGKKGGQMPIDVSVMDDGESLLSHSFHGKPVAQGYTFVLSGNPIEKTLSKGFFNTMLRRTQNFFDELFNPKFYKRALSLVNKNKANHNEKEFIQNVLLAKTELKEKDLNKILQGRTSATKINVLQYFRYSLLGKANENQYMQDMRKKLKMNEADFSAYHLDEKIKIVSDKLRDVIGKERARIQAKNAQG